MKVAIDTAVFFQLWKDKEKTTGTPLKLGDASEITGLAPETIRNIRDGKPRRFDAPVIARLCDLLDVLLGLVPFMVFVPDQPDVSAA